MICIMLQNRIQHCLRVGTPQGSDLIGQLSLGKSESYTDACLPAVPAMRVWRTWRCRFHKAHITGDKAMAWMSLRVQSRWNNSKKRHGRSQQCKLKIIANCVKTKVVRQMANLDHFTIANHLLHGWNTLLFGDTHVRRVP